MNNHHGSRLSPRHPSIRIALAVCFLAGVAGLWAQSGGADATSYYFPRFISGGGSDSGLAIFNPSTSAATASLTLVQICGIERDPVTVTIPPLGRVALTASELFGDTGDNASLRLTSTKAGLYAVYSAFDTANTYADAAGGAQSALHMVFPVAPGTYADSMEIALRNATARNTAVELKLYDLKGVALGTTVVPIAANASYRGFVGQIFSAVKDLDSASHIVARGKPASLFSEVQPFYGTSLFSGAPPVTGSSDVAALNGLALTETFNAGAFPYFHTGGGHFSIVSVANVESASVDVTLTAVRNDGTSAGSQKVSISANGGLREAVQSLFPDLASGEEEGWILVQATGRIAANILYGQSDAGSLSVVPLQRTPQYGLVFPQAVRTSTMNTEMSIVNPGPAAADVDVYVVNPLGTTLASTRINLTAGQRSSFTLDELFPELPEVPGGLVAVLSSEPVFGTASLWSAAGAVVTNFAPGAVPPSYAPTPLTSFAVKGKVFLNGEPADGFRVILSGPVGSVTTTAEDGSYEFSDLPPGKYSMKVDQYGFEFSPPVVNFEITTFSIYQDFEGFTEPGKIILLPASIPVGSPDVVARVYGTGFNEASEAFVETVRLKTNYVSPTRLEVVIPAYMSEKATTFEIYIVTDGASPNPQVTEPYPVVVFLDRPELSSVSTVGDVMEGSQGAVLQIKGSGFLPGLKVKVNGLSEGIEVNLVSDAEIIARVPASYLQIGGIYPVTVENPFPSLNAESNIQLMTVYFPSPGVERLEPQVVHVQLQDSRMPELSVFGYQFRRGAVVMFETDEIEKAPLPTVYCENTPACLAEHLIARIPPEYLRKSGFARITVQNPVPSLGGSEARILRIDGLQPTITSVVPGSLTLMPVPPSLRLCPPDDPECVEVAYRMIMPVLVNGTNIGPQTEVRIYRSYWDPLPPFSQAGVVIVGPTQLYVNWIVTPDAIGEWWIQIKNIEPGGGVSEPVRFVLTQGNFVQNPFLLSINPASVAAGGPSFTLTVNGVNLQQGSQIYFSTTQLVTTFVSGTELRAEVPAYLIKYAGKRPVFVINPDNGGESNRLFIEVQ